MEYQIVIINKNFKLTLECPGIWNTNVFLNIIPSSCQIAPKSEYAIINIISSCWCWIVARVHQIMENQSLYYKYILELARVPRNMWLWILFLVDGVELLQGCTGLWKTKMSLWIWHSLWYSLPHRIFKGNHYPPHPCQPNSYSLYSTHNTFYI